MLVSFFDTCVLFSLIPHSQEAIVKFVACLRQHAALRNVADGAYWVCAYANNQHRLKECQTLLWAMSLGEFRMVQTMKVSVPLKGFRPGPLPTASKPHHNKNPKTKFRPLHQLRAGFPLNA